MRVLMEITRRGDHYAGSLTRTEDQRCVPFVGVLELMAALEELGQESFAPPGQPTNDQGDALTR